MVHGDWPIGHRLIAQPGIHNAVENQHGAVSVAQSVTSKLALVRQASPK
jgi:hypothetical protein